MAWSAPMTFADSTALTAGQLNAYLRDNLMETMVAKASNPGSMFVTTDTNQLTERIPVSATVASAEGTTSTTYADLFTPGPAVTAATGSSALVVVSCLQWNNTANTNVYMSFAVSGDTTAAASDNNAFTISGNAAWQPWRGSMGSFITNLTHGNNTFTAKYRVNANGASFGDRSILVIPF
jgi:hypothetical protein